LFLLSKFGATSGSISLYNDCSKHYSTLTTQEGNSSAS
jgi:hypothetical protein